MASLAPHFHFPSFLLMLSLSPILITIAKNITVGETYSTRDSPLLLSPSGDFTFGFHPLSARETYLLSIWYTHIPQKTIVWYNQHGVIAPKGSELAFNAAQGLVLKNPKGEQIWSPPVANGVIHNCSLDDTGNLVIRDIHGITLWESFAHPRDTLLPSQTINISEVLVSRRKEDNFTDGRFEMRLLDGVIQLNTRNPFTNTIYDDSYYKSQSANSSNTGYSLSYNSSGHMYVTNEVDRSQLELTPADKIPTPAQDYYFRATLNFDGVFTWYYYPKGTIKSKNSTWSPINSIPDNICDSLQGSVDTGACGFNSICILGSDLRPTCECPPSYSFRDPNDLYGDCQPNFEISACDKEQKNNSYRLETIADTDWPLSDFDRWDNIVDENKCSTWCIEDCFCAVAIFRAQICWKKKLPLSNGQRNRARGATAFIKLKDGNENDIPFAPNPHTDKGRNIVFISSMLGTSAIFNIVLIGLIGLVVWFFHHKQLKGGASGVGSHDKHHGKFNTVSCFTYKELEEATEGFKEELGRGACAIVYKGGGHDRFSNGSETFIAVKKIDRASLGEAEKEFMAEVNIIGQTHHRNLVRLIGFCEEDEHRMLVYEFMSNGSLASFLFGELRPSWEVRINIAKGIAQGLVYLHEECSTQIIHCDIKPQNILLDESYQAKISDFGLSKLLKLNQFQTHTAVRGTKGYLAPEWFRNKPVNVKVDVYSFGVLLLEIVSCRRCIDLHSVDEERAILSDFAIHCYECGDLAALVVDDSEALQSMQMVERLVMVAIWCIQEDPNVRPTMRQVSQMLEGVVEVPAPPLPVPDSFSVTCQ